MNQEKASTHTPIRVVRIIDRLNIGGPAKHVTWLTSGLNPKEFETVLITGIVPWGEGDMGYFARAAGVNPVVIQEMSREINLRDVVVILKLLYRFWKLKPHIIHTHKAKAGAVGRIAGIIYKWATPSILWLRPRTCYLVHTYHGHIFHSYYGPFKTRFFITIERILARLFTDRIIAISEQQRREISEHFRVGNPEQFRVIPLGIDLNERAEDRSNLREELGVTRDKLLIGMVGRLCEVKNPALLLEAVAQLTAQEVQVHLVMVGDGHLRKELESLSHKLGISAQVTFLGFRKDVLSLYAAFDLVVLTSLNEGTPLTLLEALCYHRAVIATEVGGVVDLMGTRRELHNGFSIWDHGITVPGQNAFLFARALKYLMEHPELRREMGKRGHAFVKANFSKDRLIGDIENLYRELINRPNVSSFEFNVSTSQAFFT
ncbi:MAG TPA: glycosyltransferase [Candidatus Limnocylindrales bacterium]|nr:glycosyltransferase [Candidatus Limnocylindrales bacterium]